MDTVEFRGTKEIQTRIHWDKNGERSRMHQEDIVGGYSSSWHDVHDQSQQLTGIQEDYFCQKGRKTLQEPERRYRKKI